jgi:ankyrin repeat protein
VIEMLLNAKANPNARDKDGNTALMEAAVRGFQNVVQMLLDRGVNLNTANSGGLTALKLAERSGHYPAAEQLRAYGAQ